MILAVTFAIHTSGMSVILPAFLLRFWCASLLCSELKESYGVYHLFLSLRPSPQAWNNTFPAYFVDSTRELQGSSWEDFSLLVLLYDKSYNSFSFLYLLLSVFIQLPRISSHFTTFQSFYLRTLSNILRKPHFTEMPRGIWDIYTHP